MEVSGLGKYEKCPVCGKKFFIPVENIYKLIVNGRVVHYCSYTCYREAKKIQDSKRVYRLR